LLPLGSFLLGILIDFVESELYTTGFQGGPNGKESVCQCRRRKRRGFDLQEMALHSSILAWKIPWTEEPDGLQSMEMQRVGLNWATKQQGCVTGRVWLFSPLCVLTRCSSETQRQSTLGPTDPKRGCSPTNMCALDEIFFKELIFKILLSFNIYLLLIIWPHHTAFRILLPQPRIEPLDCQGICSLYLWKQFIVAFSLFWGTVPICQCLSQSGLLATNCGILRLLWPLWNKAELNFPCSKSNFPLKI